MDFRLYNGGSASAILAFVDAPASRFVLALTLLILAR
jgi:hypothetical protein